MSLASGAAVRVVLTTAPDEETAARLAGGLVAARLAACVQLVPGARSFYRWQGEVRDEREVLVIVKTLATRVAEVERFLAAEHPYEVPECLAVAPSAVEARYAAWIAAEA